MHNSKIYELDRPSRRKGVGGLGVHGFLLHGVDCRGLLLWFLFRLLLRLEFDGELRVVSDTTGQWQSNARALGPWVGSGTQIPHGQVQSATFCVLVFNASGPTEVAIDVSVGEATFLQLVPCPLSGMGSVIDETGGLILVFFDGKLLWHPGAP